MPDVPSAKHGVTRPADGDFINDWPSLMRNAIDEFDALIAAAIDDDPRPAAGVFGRVHRADDGTISFDTGLGWVELARMGHGARHAPGGDDPLPAIVTAGIADNAVTNAKLADNSVGGAEIIDGAVGTGELANGAVTNGKASNGLLNTFLKLAVAADKKVSFGVYVAGFAGLGQIGDSEAINHGLGVVPDKVLFFQRSSSANAVFGGAWCSAKDANVFFAKHVALAAQIAPNYDITFDWIAFS